MSVLEDLLADAQPGYETQVLTLLRRFGAQFPQSELAGIEKSQFISRVIGTVSGEGHETQVILQVISDISSLSWWCGLPISDEAAASIGALARRIFYRDAQAIAFRLERPDPAAQTSHAVFTGNLVNPLHSPTRGAFEYVRALAADPDTRLVHVFFTGQMTEELRAHAAGRLDGCLEKISFTSIDGDPDFLLKAVQNGPRTFHIWCEAPMAPHITLVALFGPTVMFTCGDAAPLQFADAYWYCHPADYIARLWGRRGAPERFIANYRPLESAAFNRLAPAKVRTRQDLGFGANEIILVTAGNRLGVDIDQPFVDGMAALVLSDPRIRWVMVGRLQDFWISAFGQVLSDQFTHVPFDADLASLLAVTDIFVNPFRSGGGNTAIMAIDAGSVVMTRQALGDVGAFVPANHQAHSAEAYFETLAQLIDDPVLRAARLAEQQALIQKRLDQDLFAKELKTLSGLAYERFAARLPTRLETLFAQEPPKRHALKGGSGRRGRLR